MIGYSTQSLLMSAKIVLKFFLERNKRSTKGARNFAMSISLYTRR